MEPFSKPGMYSLLRFARDFPEVCDLWKAFDTRARYTADNMAQVYAAGYAAGTEAARPIEPPRAPPCQACGGSGGCAEIGDKCPRCNGDGREPDFCGACNKLACVCSTRGDPACCQANRDGPTCDCNQGAPFPGTCPGPPDCDHPSYVDGVCFFCRRAESRVAPGVDLGNGDWSGEAVVRGNQQNPELDTSLMTTEGRRTWESAPLAQGATGDAPRFVRITETEGQELTDLHTLRDATSLRARPDVGSSVALCASAQGEWNVRLDNIRLTGPEGATTLEGALHIAAEECRKNGLAR